METKIPTPRIDESPESYDTEINTEIGLPTDISRSQKFAPRVPQTILQQTLASHASNPPSSDLSKTIITALIQKLNYTPQQCAIICQNMTKMTLPSATVVIPENTATNALYYVEAGSLKSADGVHMIMTNSIFGDVFGIDDSSINSGVAASEESIVWTISR